MTIDEKKKSREEDNEEVINNREEKIRKLYYTIYSLQRKAFGHAWPRDLDSAIEEYAKYLHMEVDEMLKETNFKKHKRKHSIDMKNLKMEIVDIVIYGFATASIVFDNYEEFVKLLEEKVAYNNVRQDWEMNK